ncbi:hypothetical protein ACI2KR_29910 [Pseudomonas luteola]
MPDHHDPDEWVSRHYPIQEDLSVQKRIWIVERAGWYVLCVIVLFTLLGLFSKGPLSESVAKSQSGNLIVSYERFVRNGASMPVRIQARADSTGKAIIMLDGDLLKSFSVESMQPEPASARSHGSGMELTYTPDESGWAQVHLSLRSQQVGISRSIVSTHFSEPPLALNQFVYP